MVIKVVYPANNMVLEDAMRKILPVEYVQNSNIVGIVVPNEIRNKPFSVHYFLGITDDNELIFGTGDVCEDQQGCGSVAYGDIIAPSDAVYDENTRKPITWILAVLEINENNNWVRYVGIIENNSITKLLKAPVILEVTDTNGNKAYIPVGNPIAAIGVTEILKWAAVIGGTIATWKIFDWLKEREKREMVDKIIESSKDNPEIARLVLHPVAGETVDSANGSILAKLKDFIISFGGLFASIIVLLKISILVNLIRELFKR